MLNKEQAKQKQDKLLQTKYENLLARTDNAIETAIARGYDRVYVIFYEPRQFSTKLGNMLQDYLLQLGYTDISLTTKEIGFSFDSNE